MYSKMKLLFQVSYAIAVFFVLVIYNIISTSILFFIPRVFRRKKDIKGQRVLITGAGRGLGRALAVEFSKHATCLMLVDIDKQALLHTNELLDPCSLVFIYECDVSDYKKVYAMAKQIQSDAGDVDILVNNAGIVNGEFLWDLPEEKIIKTMEVNALAHFWTCKAFLPAMMKENRGHIVSIISIGGMVGVPKVSDYCASKFAALGFAESLEMELRIKKLDGVKITIVCPSIIDTGLFEGAEFKFAAKLSPTYVAKEVVAGIQEDKEFIILPRYLTIPITVKQLIPRWITIIEHEILDSINAMKNFAGREQVKNGTDIKDPTKKKD